MDILHSSSVSQMTQEIDLTSNQEHTREAMRMINRRMYLVTFIFIMYDVILSKVSVCFV